ncbi:hypothetical protein DH2020_041219 [Rehmannia glutinosa]|uniref:Uncharacterized protein n=1 Tax=Rehmannia glutinosa TaxID=99300 RepID=A0ABR0URX7_REHGL
MGAKSSTTPSPSPAGVFIRPHHQSSAHVSAGFGLNLSSRDEFINGLASYGNKAATVTGGGTTGPGPAGGTNNPSSLLIHDMMMGNPGFEGSDFEDMTFGGILNHASNKKDQEERLNFDAALDQFSSRNGGNEGGGIISDGMTRDFLGLRPLSQSDIMSIAGLSNCMNNNAEQTHKSWQG